MYLAMDLIGMKKKVDAMCIYSGNCFPFLQKDECSFYKIFTESRPIRSIFFFGSFIEQRSQIQK